MEFSKWGGVVGVVLVVGVVWLVGAESGLDGSKFTNEPRQTIAVLLGCAAVVAAVAGAFAAGGAWALRAAGVLTLAAACLLSPGSWGPSIALGLAIGLPAFAAALPGKHRDGDVPA